jgi:hypothetical protein
MPGFSVNGRDPMAAGTFSVGHRHSLMGSVRLKYGDAAYSETELFAKVLWQIEDAPVLGAVQRLHVGSNKWSASGSSIPIASAFLAILL